MLELDDHDGAARLAEAAIERHALNPILLCQAHRALGRARSGEGDESSAEAAFVAAADEAKRVGLRFLEVQALAEAGRSYDERRAAVIASLHSDERELEPLLG